MPRGPARFSRAGACNGPAGPDMGEHDDGIYRNWPGLNDEEIAKLEANAII